MKDINANVLRALCQNYYNALTAVSSAQTFESEYTRGTKDGLNTAAEVFVVFAKVFDIEIGKEGTQ